MKYGYLLQVPEQRLRKTKETKHKKQNNFKERLIPNDQKYKALVRAEIPQMRIKAVE